MARATQLIQIRGGQPSWILNQLFYILGSALGSMHVRTTRTMAGLTSYSQLGWHDLELAAQG